MMVAASGVSPLAARGGAKRGSGCQEQWVDRVAPEVEMGGMGFLLPTQACRLDQVADCHLELQ